MNRFFRSALFPLVVIAALVWLAITTLGRNQRQEHLDHDVRVHPGRSRSGNDRTSPTQVSDVVFDPNKQSISATVTDLNVTRLTTRT